ncbi:MAG: hypothetical protein ACRD88_02355, partial [Terriglobia bacterium]
MGGKTGRKEAIWGLAVIALLGMIPLAGFAQNGKQIPAKIIVISDCPANSCATDAGGWDPVNGFVSALGSYSLLPANPNGLPAWEDIAGDGTINDGAYETTATVLSAILTHNTVANLNSLDSLSPTGTVIEGVTTTLTLHFYNHLGLIPPPCWGNRFARDQYTGNDGVTYTTISIDQTQAVNWAL